MKAVNEVAYNKIICPKCYKEHMEDSKLYDEYYNIELSSSTSPLVNRSDEFIAECGNEECKQKFRVVYQDVIRFTSSLITEKDTTNLLKVG